MKRKKFTGEKKYYSEINAWFKSYLSSNMKQFGSYLVDAEICDPRDLSQGIKSLVTKNKIKSDVLLRKAALTRGLKVDLILFVYDQTSKKSEIIICEVKNKRGLSLHDCSQLAGYCICADVNFGLLVNVDGSISDALREILAQNTALTNISQIVNNRKRIRRIGFLMWESSTKRGVFLPNGYFKSFTSLCKEIAISLR